MGKRGFLGDLCGCFDRMEEEMRGLCRLFRKEERHHCDRRQQDCRQERRCCPPRDCVPPCGRERFCCEREEKEDKCD